MTQVKMVRAESHSVTLQWCSKLLPKQESGRDFGIAIKHYKGSQLSSRSFSILTVVINKNYTKGNIVDNAYIAISAEVCTWCLSVLFYVNPKFGNNFRDFMRIT